MTIMSLEQFRGENKPLRLLNERDRFLFESYSEQIEKLYELISGEEPVKLLHRKYKQLACELELFKSSNGEPDINLLVGLLNILSRQKRAYVY